MLKASQSRYKTPTIGIIFAAISAITGKSSESFFNSFMSKIVKLGKVIFSNNKNIYDIINEGTKLAYSKNILRPSILKDPLRGENTNNNTPPFINIEIIDEPKVIISYLAKGGGSENASCAKMLNPSDGFEGVKLWASLGTLTGQEDVEQPYE